MILWEPSIHSKSMYCIVYGSHYTQLGCRGPMGSMGPSMGHMAPMGSIGAMEPKPCMGRAQVGLGPSRALAQAGPSRALLGPDWARPKPDWVYAGTRLQPQP